MSFKRARNRIFKDKKWNNYDQKKAQIINLKNWATQDIIDVYYFDESGFSLDSNIPYYWSPIGKPVEIPSNRFAKRTRKGNRSQPR